MFRGDVGIYVHQVTGAPGITHQGDHARSPQENGAPERLHRTLKAQATKPPATNLNLQQLSPQLFTGPFPVSRRREVPAQEQRRGRRCRQVGLVAESMPATQPIGIRNDHERNASIRNLYYGD